VAGESYDGPFGIDIRKDIMPATGGRERLAGRSHDLPFGIIDLAARQPGYLIQPSAAEPRTYDRSTSGSR
jgi:hypothetical protein